MRPLVFFNSKRNPLSTKDFFSEFDSFFDDFSPTRYWPNPEYSTKELASDTSVDENDKAFLVSVDLPGVKPDDIKLDVTKNRIHVHAERKSELTENGKTTKSFGHYSETFTIPEEVNSEKIEAHFEHGVLTLILPKEASGEKKSIQVKHGHESKGLLDRWFAKPAPTEQDAKANTEKKLNS